VPLKETPCAQIEPLPTQKIRHGWITAAVAYNVVGEKPQAIAGLKRHKARGEDGIPSEYFHIGKEAYPWLCAMKERLMGRFNPYYHLRNAHLVTLSKTKVSTIPSADKMRPIQLISNQRKLFESGDTIAF